MTDYTPQVGHRVRVTEVTEGVVSSLEANPRAFRLVDKQGHNHYVNADWETITVEHLSDPEPNWQPGDIVTDARGYYYARETSGECVWLQLGTPLEVNPWCMDDYLPRPLTPLFRGGKPWTDNERSHS